MLTFLGILAIPLVISLVLKLVAKFDITWPEYCVQFVMGVACLGLIWLVGNSVSATDTEVLNGSVTGKHAWRFSCPVNTSNPCRNGYSCNCRPVPYECGSTDSKGNYQSRTCYRTECDTCYEYSWEQNWYVKTNLPGGRSEIEIDRVDEQGAVEPQRYSVVRIGDPASTTHSYKNWVKASANSLFKEDELAAETHKALLGTYPISIVDYYRIDRIVTPNVKLANEAEWNEHLSRALSKLGPSNQLNTVVVFVEGAGRDYAFGLRRHWQGFKKNDAVIVVGLRNGAIQWAEIMSWSKNSIFNINTRNMIEDKQGTHISQIDPAVFMAEFSVIAKRDFVRRPMQEFEYLKGDIPPPKWLIILSVITAVVFGVGTSVLFHRIDIMNLNSNYSTLGRRYSYRRFN